MSDTARDDYRTVQPAAINGLDDFFEVREQDASQDANVVRLDATRDEVDASLISVEEASARLGISIRAVQKRLKKGTLAGRKQKTTHGERWLVEIREQDASQDANFVRLDANRFEVDATVVRLDASRDEQDANRVDRPDPLILELQAKVEAASYRIGYLEAQLDAERQQVKLLTDSQHKPSRWARFYSWFIGR